MIRDRRAFLAYLPFAAAIPSGHAATRSAPSSLQERLLSAVEEIRLVDSHEHIYAEEDRVRESMDFFTLAKHYVLQDAISAGLPRESVDVVLDEQASSGARWRAFEPFWKRARFTGYGQALRIAIRDIYGVEEISAETLSGINDRIRQENKPGFYKKVLIDRAKIRYAVLDDNWNAAPLKPDPRFFVYARKFDRFVTPGARRDVEELESLTGVSITSLAGLKRAMERSFEQSLEAGMVTVKSTLAYDRKIVYQEAGQADAERDFEALMAGQRALPEGFRTRFQRPFRQLEDHMFHHLVGLAEAHGLPMQIHTGQHFGNGNVVTNSNPTHLINLFFLYPKVNFDLFHMSHPYQGELAVLAKTFPNVYADFCWAYIISPPVARRALHEMMETAPMNKILGFGGDYHYAEMSYAHSKMARRNIAQVLAEKVESGFCTEDEALEIAQMLLHDNAARLFPQSKSDAG